MIAIPKKEMHEDMIEMETIKVLLEIALER